MARIQDPRLIAHMHHTATILEKAATSLRHPYVDTELLQSLEESVREIADAIAMIRDTQEVYFQ